MRRVNSYEVFNSIGMWAQVRMVFDSDVVDGIIGVVSDSYLCFACNYRTLNGSNEFRTGSGWDDIVSGYEYRWCIRRRDCGGLTLPEIISSEGFDVTNDITFIGIINEHGYVIDMHGALVSETDIPSISEMSFINEKYNSDTIYKGVHSYHYHHSVTQNSPKTPRCGHKIGVELEIEFKRSSMKQHWSEKFESNWFYCERDGSLQESTGVEIITVPMNPKDIKNRTTWEKLIGYLSDKARSWDSPRCGLHVHIGREVLGKNPEQQSETIGKLLYLYHHFINGTTLNTRIFGRERAYNEKDGKTSEGEAVATLGSGVLKLKEIKDTLKKGMIEKSSSDRYFDINLQNTHTIEFRKGRGSIKVSRIITVIEYCEMLCKYAKSAKWEEISKERFEAYVVNNISKDSPLYSYFECGEQCNI